MTQNRLRVYYGPEESAAGPATIPLRESVQLTLGEVLPLLVEAAKSRRAWVDDFADDQITICDLTGTGAQDTAIAVHAVALARRAGAGRTIAA